VAAAFLAKNGDGPAGWRSGWLVFPASSTTFTVTGGSSRSFAGLPRTISEETACEPLSCAPLEECRTPWPLLAFSRVCPHGVARVRRDVPFAPPSTCHRSVHSGVGDQPTLRLRGFHPRSPVPSSWFCTTSMGSSASGVAGLLHPAADPGVHHVSVPSDR
jgi:hypothetical protein